MSCIFKCYLVPQDSIVNSDIPVDDIQREEIIANSLLDAAKTADKIAKKLHMTVYSIMR